MGIIGIIYGRKLILYCKKRDKLIIIGQFVPFLVSAINCRGPPVSQIRKFEMIGGQFFE